MSKDELVPHLQKATRTLDTYSRQYCVGDSVGRKCAKKITAISMRINEIIGNIEAAVDGTSQQCDNDAAEIPDRDHFSSSTKVESRQELQAVSEAIG